MTRQTRSAAGRRRRKHLIDEKAGDTMIHSTFERQAGAAAMLAGVLFVAIQPIHPAETLAAVTTTTWAAVHVATLLMTILFGIGIVGVHTRQREEAGRISPAGLAILGAGLFLTAAFVFVEAFVAPVLAATDPGFVEALLALVAGAPTTRSLGVLPALWSASGMLFLGGCVLFGAATLRARVLPRAAAALFGFGLPVTAIVTALLPVDLHRLGAAPIGIGLAWLGYATWRGAPRSADRSARRERSAVRVGER